MFIPRDEGKNYLRNCDFKGLFIELLGWDKATDARQLELDGVIYQFEAFAGKAGVIAYACRVDNVVGLKYKTRLKLEQLARSSFPSHLFAFYDDQCWSVWQWMGGGVFRNAGPCGPHSSYEPILQKLDRIAYNFEQENIQAVQVESDLKSAFYAETVTKNFYSQFEAQYKEFLAAIEGVAAPYEKEFASLLLNRLMFLYFMQRKGFLLGETDYLYERFLDPTKRMPKGDDFFSGFLVPLFFEVLSVKPGARGGKDNKNAHIYHEVFGEVLYLNGGLFSQRDWERNGKIKVPDEALKKIFDFFGDWNWHLDERPTSNGKEINPDVLGYVFEKFINQKQMGAYYTKEDITGYIARNTILPFLLEKSGIDLARPLQLLRENIERYVYPAVAHGCELTLPDNIVAGVGDVAARGGWNQSAPAEFALPTEIWREVVARRARYEALTGKVMGAGLTPSSNLGVKASTRLEEDASPANLSPAANSQSLAETKTAGLTSSSNRVVGETSSLEEGAISANTPATPIQFHTVADLITHNLDIAQWMSDLIADINDARELEQLWAALEEVTILDPTVGSGAFLFAAMGVLGPVYQACLERMDAFVGEAQARAATQQFKAAPAHELMEAVLREIEGHPNRAYAIFKKQAVGNLFGVDIMPEASEICKLRLFLKLAAQVSPDPTLDNYGIEPLPDIDFNVRAGNTLVGFASAREVESAAQTRMDFAEDWPAIKTEMATYGSALDNFRVAQLSGGAVTKEAKTQLNAQHDILVKKLDKFNALQYQDDVDPTSPKYVEWKASHQPFHWCAEFYSVMCNGGFDVIIGNPPYLSAAKERKNYKVLGYETKGASDIYAWVLERVKNIGNKRCWSGMIVPLSLSFSGDFDICRKMLISNYGSNWFSSYARIPAALFAADVRVRNVIWLGNKSGGDASYTTRLHRWFEDFRPHLIESLSYSQYEPIAWNNLIPKTNTPAVTAEFERLNAKPLTIEAALSSSQKNHTLHFKKSAYNWLCFCLELPPCYDADDKPIDHTEFGTLHFADKQTQQAAYLFLNGKIQFDYWAIMGDDFHVAKWMFANFPFNLVSLPNSVHAKLKPLAAELETAMQANVSFKRNAGKLVGNYNLARCRAVTDKSDAIFAEHLGLTAIWPDIQELYNQIVRTSFDD